MAVPYRHMMFSEHVPMKVRKVTVDQLIWKETEEQLVSTVTKHILAQWDTEQTYDDAMKQQIEEQFTFQYSYADGQIMKQKLSVSELKKRAYMEQDGTEAFKEEEVIPLLPKFLQEDDKLTGASRGSAYHRFLELLDYTREYDAESLTAELADKERQGLLSEEMAECIRVQDILAFFETSVAGRMRMASIQGKYFAEQPFVLGMEAKGIYPETGSDECLLVQGIIDVYFEEEDGLVLLDYKTDKVFSAQDLVVKYKAQLDYYAKALERLTGKKVKEKIIYSFALAEEIEVK